MDSNLLIDVLETQHLPIAFQEVALSSHSGLVIVDIVKGFAQVGCGPLAPSAANLQIEQMVRQTDRLARMFLENSKPVFAFLDTHTPGKAEPPYPPHCEIGSGQEDWVDELAWLDDQSGVTQVRKDCINGFIGAISERAENAFVKWVNTHALEQIIVVGICTDICVMDFVLTVLSARNHGMLGKLSEVVVYEPGCATYDLPAEVVGSLGLPATATHPQKIAHHLGLYCMASRGAVLTQSLI